MDQDTTGKSGSRSWRDRLGIDETREQGTEPRLDNGPSGAAPSRPAPQQATPQSGPGVEARVVAKPAPMAPRPGTVQKAPPAPTAAPGAPRPAAAPSQSPVSKPASAPVPQRAAQDDAFAERLRKHREAAEAAVKKRSTTASLDKFSFARKEVETAKRESDEPSPAPRPAPAQQAAPAPQPAPQPRPVAAQPQPQQPAPYQPMQGGVYQPHPGNQLPAPPVARQPAYPPAQPPRPIAPQQQPYRQPPPQVGGYGQQPYGHPQQQPAYRPQGPGYAPPPGAAPRRPAPPANQGYGQGPAGQAPRQVQQQQRAPAPQSYAPPPPRAPHGDDDLFEENGYRPAAPLGRAVPGDRSGVPSRNDLRSDFDDPFSDNAPQPGYGGRSARDYSQAYREFDDDYEDEPKRGWGGIIMLILALVAMGAVAIGLIYMYQSGKTTTSGEPGAVPTVTAPEQPAKAAPDAGATQQGQQPQGQKLIYERILGGDSANQPEQIVPREETPIAPPPASEGGDSLPLPLPPPPQTQGSIDPGDTQEVVAISETTDSQEGAAGVEPAASAISRGPIANPPVPRPKPGNLQVASIQQPRSSEPAPEPQVFQPPAPQPEVYQPPAPQSLDTLIQQSVQQPIPQQAPQPAATAPVRNVARDDDPLAGSRQPFNSQAQAQAQQAASAGPQSLQPLFPQQQQQVALAPPPTPAPAPSQPVTSQDLQAFAPPAPSQPAPQTGDTGYVIQLAAYRSEGEAMTQYQQLKARHANLVGNLPPSVQQTNLGASGTFYRLGMGPMQSKQAATELCNKLIAAGERDCLVRRR